MEQSYEILAVDDDAAIVNILETTLTRRAIGSAPPGTGTKPAVWRKCRSPTLLSWT